MRRAHPPRSDVAEYVQHARTLRHIFRQGTAVGRLIEEPSGLLTLQQRRLEFEAVLDHQCRLIEVAPRRFHIAGQALHFPRRTVVLEQQGIALQNFNQGFLNLRFQPFHAGGTDLHDAGCAIAVDHQPRQAVGLAVYQPIIGLRVQPIAQGQRRADAGRQPRRIRNLPGLEQSRGDERFAD